MSLNVEAGQSRDVYHRMLFKLLGANLYHFGVVGG